MNKSGILLWFLVALAVSCTKDDLLSSDQDQFNTDQSLLKAAKTVIQVADESDDDTEALLEAFALAQASGKGAVIELLPGTFEIGMIEIREFFGTLNGSGKGASIVTNLSDLDPDPIIANNKLPALIKFVGGDVTVSNLTVQLSEGLDWLGTMEMNMLLFSDYSEDFLPVPVSIKVNLENIEVAGLIGPDVELWPDGPVVPLPYNLFNGVKFSMDKQLPEEGIVPRSIIDATVNNCEFYIFSRGIYVWGCKKGNFQFGTKGGNIFEGNNQGLVVNENFGVNVKVAQNEFTIPDWHWNGIDLNTGEEMWLDFSLEKVQGNLGTYDINNNVFNIYYSNGMGIMDAWRYAHPENPSWMKMTWKNNIFNAMADGAWMGVTFNMKNVLFQGNTVVGDALGGYLGNSGIPWIFDDDPNYLLSWSESCKFINNRFLQPDFFFSLDFDTRDYYVMGDLSYVIFDDRGVDNRFNDKLNYGHSNEKKSLEVQKRMERIKNMYLK